MIFKNRIAALERELAELSPAVSDDPQEDAFSAWVDGGCVGPLPEAGRLPEHLRRKFCTQERWERSHRFLVALCCRERGRDEPPGMDDAERREVDEAFEMMHSVAP
jgi:hypothetical protein